MDRRQYLIAVGGSCAIGLSGCLDSDDDDEHDEDPDVEEEEPDVEEEEPDVEEEEPDVEEEEEPDAEIDNVLLVDHAFAEYIGTLRMAAVLENNRDDVVDIRVEVILYQDDHEIDQGFLTANELLSGEEREILPDDSESARLDSVNDPDLVTDYEIKIYEGDTLDESKTLEFDGEEFRSRYITE